MSVEANMSATEKDKELDSSSIHSNVSATVSICCSCSSRRPSCKKFWCGFNNYWRLLIMLLVVVFYLLLGAVIFGAHCKKKSVQCTPNMVCYVCPNWNTLYGVKSHHILGVCLTPNWVCFHTNSVCFPTNFSVFSHSL